MNEWRRQVTGAILAGGRGSRMGGRDKGLINVDGRPLIEHVLTRLRPQVGTVVIVANRNLARYGKYNCPVLSDEQPGYAGPLAGIASALSTAATPYVLIAPCDGPRLPRNLAVRLYQAAAAGAEIAVADDGSRLQPLFALLHTSLLPDVRQFMNEGGRSVHEWYGHHGIARVDFSDCAMAFVNLNSPDEVASRSSIKDRLNRPLRDLRVSVTDRCNFRCVYCMPRAAFGAGHRFLPRTDLLSFEEIERIARAAAALGVRKVRLTGGEPLLRRDLDRLIAMLASIGGLDDIALTTNGALLARHANALQAAGLNRVTVSLDTLDGSRFRRMADSVTPVSEVIAGIEAAARVGLAPVKINMVVKRGTNDGDVLAMAERFRHSGHVLRFIEYMDVGNSNGWRSDEVVPAAEIRDAIAARWPLTALEPHYAGEVARRYRYGDGGGEIGFITSISRPFCGDCTRARLSADGRLYTCLFAREGFDLRKLLRGGISETNLQRRLGALWMRRSDRYSELRAAQASAEQKVEMSYIGG
ncbi:MAG TPA: GTP 3',8-cyclase MoaA [Gammaproteobacteria bacterium]|nr:GTP 3',8-cyclase MoaA [Gammaproteobacteria bacterium]